VSDKLLEMRHFPVFTDREVGKLAPSRAAGVARERQDDGNGFGGGRRV